MVKYLLFYICLAVLSLTGCIEENYSQCPDFGKYNVLFFDLNNRNSDAGYFVNIYINDDPKSHIYVKAKDSSIIKTSGYLKLNPGKYRFKAFMANAIAEESPGTILLKNSNCYLFADTIGPIIKTNKNEIILRFIMVNALIRVNCMFDNPLNYRLLKLEISNPCDRNTFFDIHSGKSSYSNAITGTYGETLFDNSTKTYRYYTVPIAEKKSLNFKVSILNLITDDQKVLYKNIYLEEPIEQGNVYSYKFNITPNKIDLESSSVIDWNTYINSSTLYIN